MPLPRERTPSSRLLGLVRQIGGVGVVDGDAFGRGERGGGGRLGRRRPTGGGLGEHGAELLGRARLRRGAEHHRPAQRGLGDAGLVAWFVARAAPTATARLPIAGQATGHILLEHGMEVRAAEAERAHARAAHLPGRHLPLGEFGVDVERRRGPVDVRVGLVEAEARGDRLVVQCEGGLEQASGAGRRLQVADVRLHRAEGDRSAARCRLT